MAAIARSEQRVIITEDRDFGRLVHVLNKETCGVIYIRWRPQVRHLLGGAVVRLVDHLGDDLPTAVVVLTPGGARVRRPRR